MTIEPLNTTELHHLRAAEGWLGLGDFDAACNELERITSPAKSNPLVLSMRYDIYAKAQMWDHAATIAIGLKNWQPGKPENWIKLAYATRRKNNGGLLEAATFLRIAHCKFPDEWLIPFNLACYWAQLGKLEEAEKWLNEAVELGGEQTKNLALEDEDLKPLWDTMKTIFKKQK